MSFSTIFTIINIIVAVLMIIGGIGTCLNLGFPNIMRGILVFLLGFITIAFEFKLSPIIVQPASFMFSFWGRGLFYLFIGLITLNYNSLSLGTGITIIVFGFVYIILHCTKIDPPRNMRKGSYEETLGQSTGQSTDQSTDQSPGHSLNDTPPSYPQSSTEFPENHKPYPESKANSEYPPTDYAKAGAA